MPTSNISYQRISPAIKSIDTTIGQDCLTVIKQVFVEEFDRIPLGIHTCHTNIPID